MEENTKKTKKMEQNLITFWSNTFCSKIRPLELNVLNHNK